MSVLDGNPSELTDRAADLLATSGRIQDVIDTLRDMVDDDKARAVDKLHDLADDVRGQLDRIHGRYDGTAHAIRDYAVELTDAHARADAAYEDLEAARTEVQLAEGEVAAWEHAIDNAEAGADTTHEHDGLSGAMRTLGIANDAVSDAQERIEQARRDMEDAAEDAMDRIERAIADTQESWRDKVGEFFDDLGDFFQDIGEWIADFFASIVDFLQKLAATITAILSALVVLALIVAFFAAFGPLGLALGLLIAGGLAAYIAWSIASDVARADPKVTPYDPTKGPRGKHVSDTPPTLETVLDGTSEVDDLGDTEESVVKITKVLGPDGEWYYTVTLPSTQEWLARFGDDGAVNDDDSNLALMLTPSLQTQYEAAVLDAIEQAGITPEDNLMLVGFSQGGIMAGHLAAYNSDLGVDAVVVSGAPIDHMPIPDSVDVVSVQHDYDPVPRLDSVVGDGAPEHGSNWTTIQEPSAGAGSPVDVGNIHNSGEYSSTLQEKDNIDRVRQNHPGLDNYFDHDGPGTRVEYYHWQE